MSDTPFLSLIIPAWNEQECLPATLQTVVGYLAKQEYTAEVIVVDDGSTDGTPETVRAFLEEHPGQPAVRLIESDHRGKGYAVRIGMLAGRGQYLVFTDADLPTPIYEIGKMVGALESGADIAIGTREGIGSQRVNEPYLRHLLGRIFNLLVRTISGLTFHDTQAGFKGFRQYVARDLFRRVRLYGEDAKPIRGGAVTAFDVEVLYLAQQSGYRVEEIPVKWTYGKQSRIRPLPDSWRMIRDVIQIRRMASQGLYD